MTSLIDAAQKMGISPGLYSVLLEHVRIKAFITLGIGALYTLGLFFLIRSYVKTSYRRHDIKEVLGIFIIIFGVLYLALFLLVGPDVISSLWNPNYNILQIIGGYK